MPQAEIHKPMEKQKSHFSEIQGCLSVQHSGLKATGNADNLAWIYNLKIETSSRKQKNLILNHSVITLLIILDPSHVDKQFSTQKIKY